MRKCKQIANFYSCILPHMKGININPRDNAQPGNPKIALINNGLNLLIKH